MKEENEEVGVINKYYFNKKIFRSAVILMFILLVVAFINNDASFKNEVYIHCDSEPYCANPYYGFNPCPHLYLCEQELLNYGDSYGDKPNFIFDLYLPLSLIIIIFSFLINHLLYNKQVKL